MMNLLGISQYKWNEQQQYHKRQEKLCILCYKLSLFQTLGKPWKCFSSIIDMLWDEIKWNQNVQFKSEKAKNGDGENKCN